MTRSGRGHPGRGGHGPMGNGDGGPGWDSTGLPLAAAVAHQHRAVVVILLSHGADPNGSGVMGHGAYDSTTEILQLLVDAGGDVNRKSGWRPPIFGAIDTPAGDVAGKVRVLLSQPSLDLTITDGGKTAEQYARERGKTVIASMIAAEVRRALPLGGRRGIGGLGGHLQKRRLCLPPVCLLLQAARRATLVWLCLSPECTGSGRCTAVGVWRIHTRTRVSFVDVFAVWFFVFAASRGNWC